ncbi:hypothetical protein LCGC14_3112480, partial [marine sediment metagenome]
MADTTVTAITSASFANVSVRSGPVWIDAETAYVIFVDLSNDLVYVKTSDGGATWGSRVVIHAGTIDSVSLWYDRWTLGDIGDTIHIVYLDTASDDVFYRDLDTSDDSLGTEITVFAGVSFT